MRYFIAIAIVTFIIVLSCNTSNQKGKLLTVDNLPSKEYTINIDKDTTLQTENGALLKIPKGALKSENGNSVTLEIKEAYSLSQMIRAGLVTQSNGEPLSSGGMIYINATAGQKVTIARPIKVVIPADYLEKGMQLYKGEENNGKIDWTNPVALPENKQLASIDTGKILFQQNCASCHAIGKDLTGPDLAHFIKRFPNFGSEGDGSPYDHNFAYLYPTVRSRPFSFEFSGDSSTIKRKLDSSFDHLDTIGWHSEPYNCNLIKLYGGVLGPQFNFSWREWKQIYNYIQNESDRRNLPFPAHDYLRTCIDSCNLYKEKVKDLHQQKMLSKSKKKYLIEDNGPLVKITPDTTWKVNNDIETMRDSLPPIDFDEKVSPTYYDAVYYQFSIESFGWLNVDMMLKETPGVEESELFAKVTGDYKEKVKTFLIIPSAKTYAEGGPAERNAEEFAYYYKDGKIPLPQNTDAYILAVTETEQSIAYGLKKFTTSRQQEIEISLHAATKEEFSEAMKEFDTERLHIKVADTKNANEIRKTDTTLRKIDEQLKDAEKLKPKRCDCDCDHIPIVVATTAANK